MRPLVLHTVNRAYRASLRPAWRRFAKAARDPQAAQGARLRALLRGAAGTSFAQEHGLARVRTLADFQSAVPVRDYDGLAPWVERTVAGEPRVLTRDAPVAFETSSGSTRASKYLPFTRAFLREMSAATGPWLYDLLRRRPALLGGSAYWSISPVARPAERTPGGVPVGLADDTEYFPRPVRRLLRLLLPVPPQVARLSCVGACRHATLCYLLADPRLRFISVWSPSFLTLLLEHARSEADGLAHDLARGVVAPPGAALPPGLLPPLAPDPRRAELVRAALTAGDRPDLRAIWPRLTLVSCWADAGAARLLPALRALLPPGLELQPKGLLATEGVVSFPLLGQEGGVLAVASHVLELQPAGDHGARPVPPHEAEPGGRYQPILSTGGGLYRYRLGDEVEVVGRAWSTPRVRFVGRRDGVSDLAGEKLAPSRVEVALTAALGDAPAPAFAFLAPAPGTPPRYVLYLDAAWPGDPERLGRTLEAELRRGAPYDHCRALGQLGPVQPRRVTEGPARYERALVRRGQRAGDVKPQALHAGTFWSEELGG